MKSSEDLKAYSPNEQHLEQFKRENGLKNDSEAVLFLLNEIAKCATRE